jgi:prepilin-type N-terminal cleavage/methylation domain-containing protein
MRIKNTTTKRNRLTTGRQTLNLSKGFTLIEIIVVIVIIGILAAIAIISYGNWQKSVVTATLKSDLNGVASAMENARTFGNAYPSSIPATFTASNGVTLSGGSTDGGITYCVTAINPQYPTIQYYISSITGAQSPQAGACVTSTPTIAIGTITSSSIGLSWNTITNATSYTLQRDVSSSFATVTTVVAQSGTSVTDNNNGNGLSSGVTYYYRVNATNAGSTSAWSTTVSATITGIVAPSAPTITVGLSSPNVTATITNAPLTCTTGTIQYALNSHINDSATWAGYSSWYSTPAAAQTATAQPANDGVKYGYIAEARCYVDASHYSSAVPGTENTYIDPITAPSAPVVAAVSDATTTTWSWGAVTCASGTTASYQYDYTISPATYDSGWVSNGTNLLIAFTTSTEGQTYTVAVQAKCTGTYNASSWSVSGSASYARPNSFAHITWTKRLTASSWYFRSVAMTSDGSRLWAGGTDNTTGKFFYGSSNYGVNWSVVNSVYGRANSIASSVDGSRLVMVMDRSIQLSTDYGANWTALYTHAGTSLHFTSITSSLDGTKLAASWSDTNSYVYYSTDSGVTWSQSSSFTLGISSIASSSDGSKLVMSTIDGRIYTSTNYGANWVLRTNINASSGRAWVASSSDGTKLVVGGYNTYIYTSTDSGATWTTRTGLGIKCWGSIASSADGTKLVAATSRDTSDSYDYVYTSTDSGVTWTKNNSSGYPTGGIWDAVATSADGRYIVAASDSDGTNYIWMGVYGP